MTEIALPPSVSAEIPWDHLDISRKSYVPSICNPDGMSTMNPDKMSVAEAYHFYGHIVSLQDTLNPFVFMPIYHVPEEIIPEIGTSLLISSQIVIHTPF
jgi:hypothetical protein